MYSSLVLLFFFPNGGIHAFSLLSANGYSLLKEKEKKMHENDDTSMRRSILHQLAEKLTPPNRFVLIAHWLI
jgi:hypothetical protein